MSGSNRPTPASKPILVTGVAGFIGYHLAEHLLARGHRVVGVDNLNSYYDVALKQARLARLEGHGGFRMLRLDLAERAGSEKLFAELRPDYVVHLAAQAGVRYSLENPHAYVDSNVVGFMNVLEGCREAGVKHLVYASSSSVYGANTRMPFSEHHGVDHPVSIYAATKRANELMAHTYSHLHGLPTTGLRFFTVYGPWYRPDMALFRFTDAIMAGRPIQVFNEGRMKRDFTYIDDIVEAMERLIGHVPAPDPDWRADAPDPASSDAPFRIYNIGNNNPVELLRLIEVLEDAIGKKAEKVLLPMQPGDVRATYADISDLQAAVGFSPATPIEEGVPRFVAWYRDYYGNMPAERG